MCLINNFSYCSIFPHENSLGVTLLRQNRPHFDFYSRAQTDFRIDEMYPLLPAGPQPLTGLLMGWDTVLQLKEEPFLLRVVWQPSFLYYTSTANPGRGCKS